MKKYKLLMSMCIFGALANCAKADIVAAQELPNGRVIVNNPTAYIGSEQNHVNTPWMIVSPDAMKGFANDLTTNAISVVSEDGTNFYAHIDGGITFFSEPYVDRTDIIHFTVDANGIPSKSGKLYHDSESNAYEYMEHRKLIGITKGNLYFASTRSGVSYLVYNPETGDVKKDPYYNYQTSYQNGPTLGFIRYERNILTLDIRGPNSPLQPNLYLKVILTGAEDTNMALTIMGDEFYVGSGETSGNIRKGNIDEKTFDPTIIATLPGPISGLSNNGDEVFATTTATNAFYNVTAGEYNVAKDENGQLMPMVPPTTNGLVRVIDNRKKGGKFLFVTAKDIRSID